MKVLRSLGVLIILIFLSQNLYSFTIEAEQTIEVKYLVTERDTPIKIPIKIIGGIAPFEYIIYPNIESNNFETGIINASSDTLEISKFNYSKPGVYIMRAGYLVSGL